VLLAYLLNLIIIDFVSLSYFRKNLTWDTPPQKNSRIWLSGNLRLYGWEVLGLRPGHVILKMLKIVATGALFSVEHIRVRVGAIIHNLLTLEPPG
jgi:hypothetical protein